MDIKKVIASVLISGVLMTGIAAYAEVRSNPARTNTNTSLQPMYGRQNMVDFISKLIGKSREDTLKLLNSDKTLAEIAQDNGVSLDDFKKAMLKQRTDYIDELAKEGKITGDRANELKKIIQNNINVCDGTGIRQGTGFGLSGMKGIGKGNGMGMSRRAIGR